MKTNHFKTNILSIDLILNVLHLKLILYAGYGPILVFDMKKHGGHRRPRRETRCTEGGNNCCHKETLEINFRDIGWDYIMAPSSIRPNFCTGSCNGGYIMKNICYFSYCVK